uniref:Uncharacterized protein n=1 Tax=Nelumbo nucifera TaxID=4432 RepID=A0A822YRH5_NELNU|nr:TPA_asm: hypothetical protein HUJ06_010649 [Nelumbo nucifera]
MGSFKGHILPGTLFLLVGIWHIWSSMVRYVKNPKGFKVRVWNPVPRFDGRLKYTELYVVEIGAFIDMCIKLLYSTHLKFFINGVLRETEAEVKIQLHTAANQRHPLLTPAVAMSPLRTKTERQWGERDERLRMERETRERQKQR